MSKIHVYSLLLVLCVEICGHFQENLIDFSVNENGCNYLGTQNVDYANTHADTMQQNFQGKM
jgi:hypothetical protein